MLLHRRKVLTGLVSLLAAPAIVKASSLMPVRGIVQSVDLSFKEWNGQITFSCSGLNTGPMEIVLYDVDNGKLLAYGPLSEKIRNGDTVVWSHPAGGRIEIG